MSARDENTHAACGTCVGERDRGMTDRGVNKIPCTPLPTHLDNNMEEYCCICGQSSGMCAVFQMKKKDLPRNWCNGEHEEPHKKDDA